MGLRFTYHLLADKTHPHAFYILPKRAKDRIRQTRQYTRKVEEQTMVEAMDWCIQQFGDENGWRLATQWAIQFSDEVAATAFRLRWC